MEYISALGAFGASARARWGRVENRGEVISRRETGPQKLTAFLTKSQRREGRAWAEVSIRVPVCE